MRISFSILVVLAPFQNSHFFLITGINDNDYLFSVSKIFNKDIIVIDSCDKEKVTILKGGQNDKNGKGNPLYLAHLRKEDAGENYYQSIVPSENIDISKR